MRSKLCLVLLLFSLSSFSQQNPKREFRAAWVATVSNIDWPSKQGLSIALQQQEALVLLNKLQQVGMNAVIFQMRPASDAFYPSDIEPWSRYLTGIPGQDPGYDPLQFWIDECHKRNMEFHAWFNPFRVALKYDEPLASGHIAFDNEDWVVKYGNSLYFDPGLPETRQFITDVVIDVVRRYDVDAVHFDDYFYPYPIIGEAFPDTLSFRKYRRGYADEQLEDWRRENVDLTIEKLSMAIKSVKPWVKFGISPFGVWRNIADDERGSLTSAGNTNYDHLYADVIKWMENGWLDYLLPQLYWHIGHPAANFETLSNWWKHHAYNRALYVGHSVYKCDPASSILEWRQCSQLPDQIRLTRKIQEIGGSAFYSAKHFYRDIIGFQDTLETKLYADPALVPEMPWIDNQPPATPRKVKKGWGKVLKWKPDKTENELDKAVRYIVYKNKVGEVFDPNDTRYISLITKETKLSLNKRTNKIEYEFRVSALDRLHNESQISDPVIIKL
ncbi:family 10 glycosylhydrolase [uncultured Sunxiuqinia sp.]|uniref:glycoside hydrolase family 10 protein n=1 Tax=uncultured Sunxiuqinia sp. TaxID=1573825 RepID=UPI0030DCFFB1|tara:strand:+ start:804 stop:2303 length:1500 start_codon:yes stop_codon:yes gene_type:complete